MLSSRLAAGQGDLTIMSKLINSLTHQLPVSTKFDANRPPMTTKYTKKHR